MALLGNSHRARGRVDTCCPGGAPADTSARNFQFSCALLGDILEGHVICIIEDRPGRAGSVTLPPSPRRAGRIRTRDAPLSRRTRFAFGGARPCAAARRSEQRGVLNGKGGASAREAGVPGGDSGKRETPKVVLFQARLLAGDAWCGPDVCQMGRGPRGRGRGGAGRGAPGEDQHPQLRRLGTQAPRPRDGVSGLKGQEGRRLPCNEEVCTPSLRTRQDQLKQQRDKLRQYQKRVTQQLEREREIARQLLRDGRKERAKLLLKKKRYREQLLDKTENQITSLETMVQNIEFTQIEMKVVEGLQIGNECLKKMHQVMSIEEVERILEETQEAVEYQRQIDELLSGSFTQEDEDAILEELNAITQEQIDLPEVPSEPLPERKPEKVPIKARPQQGDLVAAS
ncbi:charged multivesicular body protein 6 [Suricata suricatta]|nr:charged multivesicular body protein 6 [Suricata suricatta]